MRRVLAATIPFLFLVTFAMIPPVSYRLIESPPQGDEGPLLEVTLDKPTYQTGEMICIRFTLTNPTTDGMGLFFVSGYFIDYQILENGESLYLWSEHYVFTQATWTLTMAPLETRTYDFVHRDSDFPLAPGVYEVHGWVVGYADDYVPLVVVDS